MNASQALSELLERLSRLGDIELPEITEREDGTKDEGLEAAHAIRDGLRMLVNGLADIEPEDSDEGNAVNGRTASQHETLAEELDQRVGALEEAGQPISSDQLVGKTQAVIASGAAGNVKLCAIMTGALTEYGDAFSCLNLGPGEAPSGAYVLLQQGDHAQPCFQYGAVMSLADNTGIISRETAVVGTATTAKRSDAADGLLLVGNPGDYVEAVAGGNFVPTIEAVVDDAVPAVRRGFRVRRAAVDYGYLAASYAHLAALAAGANITKTGLILPLRSGATVGCLKGHADGLYVATGNGLEIAANLIQVLVEANKGLSVGASGVAGVACTATVMGMVPTPPNDATQFLNGTGAFSTPSSVPTAHHTSHENSGSDEINVGGLSGVLANAQYAKYQ